MAANYATLTIQDIADLIGVKLSNQELIPIIEQDSTKYIKDVINQANAFCASARSYRLESTHIQMALQSNGSKSLLGYDSIPQYLSFPSDVDQADIYGAKEYSISLKSILNSTNTSLSNSYDHQLHWTLLEGSYCGKISSYANSSRPSRESKAIERSVSVPMAQPVDQADSKALSTAATSQTLNSDYLIDQSLHSELHKCAFDILNSEHQDYFIATIKNLRSDVVNSLDIDLNMISEESKSQPLLPYFLQFIIGKITISMDDQQQMKVLIRFTLALLQNRYLNIPLFTHPFLRIVLTCLLFNNLTTDENLLNFSFIDSDIRRYASQALSVLVYRSESAYPELKEIIFNSLIQTLFDPNITLWSHYGALLGIKEIGMIEHALKHLGSYFKLMMIEFRLPYQVQAAESIVQLATDILYEFGETTTSEEGKEMAKNLINEIQSLSNI